MHVYFYKWLTIPFRLRYKQKKKRYRLKFKFIILINVVIKKIHIVLMSINGDNLK